MRNLLALLGAAVVAFVGLGWYLDWYKLERQPAPAGYQRLQLDINPKKIGDDVEAGIERGAEFVSHLRDKSAVESPPASLPGTPSSHPAFPGAAQPTTGAAPPAPPATQPQQNDFNRYTLPPLPPPR